jgi:hypothetical protein
MKGQAVPLGEQHQRKEARRKENEMLTKRNREEIGREIPRRRQAVIYLYESGRDETHPSDGEPSIDQQRQRCRHMATLLNVDVVREFAETRALSLLLPGLREVLVLAFWEKLDYLIVSSLDRLGDDLDEAFEIAWRLGFAGTLVVRADEEHTFPRTGETPPS